MSPQTSQTMNRDIIVDLGDIKIVQEGRGRMSTETLGACVAVSIYDPEAAVGGMVRFLLPESGLDEARALNNPYLFADTGIPMLFRRAYKLGAVKNRIQCHVAGGADVIDPREVLSIGRRNFEKALEVLGANGVEVRGKHVGGTDGMRMSLNLATGKVVTTLHDGRETEL